MTDLQRARVQRIYQPISIVFGFFVVLLVAGVAYAGWSSTVIIITPLITKVTASFPVTIGPTANADGSSLVGTIKTEEQSATITVTPKGTGTPVPAHAAGRVTIKNTTAKVQPLSVGTRLKSDSGIIARTTARVDVPAGGSVVAEVVADPLGEAGNLPPGKFIIVALWPGLQDKIYGQSSTAFTGGLATGGTTLSLNELTGASSQAEEQIKAIVGTTAPGILISLEPTSVVSVPKPEVQSASYKVTVTLKVTTITYQASQLADLEKNELTKSLPEHQRLDAIAGPAITLQDRPTKDQAVLRIDSSATAHLDTASPLLQPAAYTGLSAADIRKKLNDPATIKSTNVKLSPIWRTTAPEQAERITITVLKPQS